MYVLVRDIVGKCTDSCEGRKVYNAIRYALKRDESIRLDFDGIMNITDDFINGLLGSVVKKNKDAYNRIYYVRTKTHILTKVKGFTKSCT